MLSIPLLCLGLAPCATAPLPTPCPALPTSQDSGGPRDEYGVGWGPWYVLLPFDHPDGSSRNSKAHPPERELRAFRLNAAGPDLERKWKGKGGKKLQWRLARASQPAGPDWKKLDFVALVPDSYADRGAGTADNSVAYAWRTLSVDRPIQIESGFGSDDGCRVWLNGKLIHDKNVARGVNPRDDLLRLDLKRGVNHLLVKVNNGGGAWGAQLIGSPGGEEIAPETPQEAVNAAIERGVVYLLRRQNLDGSWNFDQKNYRNGQTALALYALMKSGLREDHPAIRRGLEFLRVHPPRRTYSMACQLLALVSTKNDRHQGWISDLAKELEDWQEGGFGYPYGQNDLSNTQYGALGLFAAMTAGVKIPDRVWLYLTRNALSHQNDDGGFGYRMGAKSTGSMTVAGLTVIGICREGYGEGGFPSQLKRKVERAVDAGRDWMAREFRTDTNPGADAGAAERWRLYYLCGMERFAALEKIETIGDYDWYRQGAHFLVKSQKDGGNWGTDHGEAEPNTAFALIFLSRGTASLTGVPSYKPGERLYATDGEEARIILRAKGDTPLDLWLSDLTPALVEEYGFDGPRGAGVYIERLEYLADGEVIAEVRADPGRPWNRQPYAIQHPFRERGPHTVRLRLHLVTDPAGEGPGSVVVDSPVLDVRIDQILEPWMLDYPDDSLANLLLDQKKIVRASSERGGNARGMAVDGLFSTAWACKSDDKAPSITVELRRAIFADRILLSHPTSREASRNHYGRATRVGVSLGAKREPLEFDLDPNEEHKSVLMLPRKMRITELTIEVLARERGTQHKDCVGFAEIELRLGDE